MSEASWTLAESLCSASASNFTRVCVCVPDTLHGMSELAVTPEHVACFKELGMPLRDLRDLSDPLARSTGISALRAPLQRQPCDLLQLWKQNCPEACGSPPLRVSRKRSCPAWTPCARYLHLMLICASRVSSLFNVVPLNLWLFPWHSSRCFYISFVPFLSVCTSCPHGHRSLRGHVRRLCESLKSIAQIA